MPAAEAGPEGTRAAAFPPPGDKPQSYGPPAGEVYSVSESFLEGSSEFWIPSLAES